MCTTAHPRCDGQATKGRHKGSIQTNSSRNSLLNNIQRNIFIRYLRYSGQFSFFEIRELVRLGEGEGGGGRVTRKKMAFKERLPLKKEEKKEVCGVVGQNSEI